MGYVDGLKLVSVGVPRDSEMLLHALFQLADVFRLPFDLQLDAVLCKTQLSAQSLDEVPLSFEDRTAHFYTGGFDQTSKIFF